MDAILLRHLRLELMTYKWALAFSKVGRGPDPLLWVIEGELYRSSVPRSSPSQLHPLEVPCLRPYGILFLFVTSVLFSALLLPPSSQPPPA